METALILQLIGVAAELARAKIAAAETAEAERAALVKALHEAAGKSQASHVDFVTQALKGNGR
jgi:hypothetical protein